MQGIADKEVIDVKEGIQEYVKSQPTTTYADLEESFRAQGLQFYLMALDNPSLMQGHTHMDLQGNLGKKYRVHYRWSNKPLRPREAQNFPKSAEENVQRLRDAGEIVDRGIPKCLNCGELGHMSKRCPQEKVQKEQATITCYNCDQTGHRIREFLQPRWPHCDNYAGTEARRAPDDLECRKCGGGELPDINT
ncbi:uncharacterized protein GGS22DRAFT_161299 [Annulohypoxylon maeteangense]|uniref:uncharacterized protein n=1 Tax=Annulohypoxylon maeteangense TaxID=1927788 RepID=UPI0020083A02|nr:uncharacterized protein GGS22DRAFT_161299 [Annulohypoxylon maeteangense]KAI0885590.1 hypothetical protein GGS22DRAFT_161299 [Annulohypoxylon maeteangense]